MAFVSFAVFTAHELVNHEVTEAYLALVRGVSDFSEGT